MSVNVKSRRRFSEEERKRLVDAYKCGSLPRKQFVKIHGIGYSTFNSWLKEKNQNTISTPDPDSWIEVQQFPLSNSTSPQGVILESPSGWRIHLATQVDLTLTRELMELCSH